MKKVTLTPKPQTATPDEWVSAGARTTGSEIDTETGAASAPSGSGVPAGEEMKAPVPMKRLTIDIPAELHTRVKIQCAVRGRKMADEIRVLLEERFSGEPSPE